MKCILAEPLSIFEIGKRQKQEDAMYPKHGEATKNDSLYIICDGMGGHACGELASNAVCDTMGAYVGAHSKGASFDDELFGEALNAAYDKLDALFDIDSISDEKKMGTTLTFLKFHEKGCFAAHIGDSRIYHIRPSEARVLHQTRDHSLINNLFDVGEITLEEMKTSKQKNVITRAMQPLQERRSNADVIHITDIAAGDYFYICSDGMLEQMDDSHIVNILSLDTSDSEKIRVLAEATADNRDNRSAYLLRIE